MQMDGVLLESLLPKRKVPLLTSSRINIRYNRGATPDTRANLRSELVKVPLLWQTRLRLFSLAI